MPVVCRSVIIFNNTKRVAGYYTTHATLLCVFWYILSAWCVCIFAARCYASPACETL